MTEYVLHLTARDPEHAGELLRAARAKGCDAVRFSVIEDGERRPIQKDELARVLLQATGAGELPLDEEGLLADPADHEVDCECPAHDAGS